MFNLRKLIKSFSYAIEGISLAIKNDQNIRIHLLVSIVVLGLSMHFNISVVEMLFVIFAIFFVIVTEMINTGIEEMTNLIKQEHHVNAKLAKDVAAGAVLIAAVYAAIVGIIVFVPKMF